MAATRGLPSSDVTIVYNDEAKSWPDYLQPIISKTHRVRLICDSDVLTSNPPLSDTKVVIVIATYGHTEFLQATGEGQGRVYGDIDADRGIIFMCGIEESHLTVDSTTAAADGGSRRRLANARSASAHFPEFHNWTRIDYQTDLAEVKKIIDRLVAAWMPETIQLHPTSADTVVPTTIILSFAENAAPPPDAKVEVMLTDEQDVRLPCNHVTATRLNKFTYSFEAPVYPPGAVGVKVQVNGSAVSRRMVLTYQPTVNEMATNIGQIYIHMLDIICSLLLNESSNSVAGRRSAPVSTVDLDLKLSSMFENETSSKIPVSAFEQLFGIHRQTRADDDVGNELPTLIHLAAKFGLQELSAKLIDLPDANYAFAIANDSGQLPDEIAQNNNHDELSNFLATFRETNEYGVYVYGGGIYNSDPRYVNASGTPTVEETLYLPMDRNRNQMSKQSSTELPEVFDEIYDDISVSDAVDNKPSSARKPSVRRQDVNMPKDQQDLVNILEMVKRKDMTPAEAHAWFQQWKTKKEGGQASSFKEKKESMQSILKIMKQMPNTKPAQSKPEPVTKRSPAAAAAVPRQPMRPGGRDRDSGVSVTSRSSRSSIQSVSESEETQQKTTTNPNAPVLPPRPQNKAPPIPSRR